MLYVLYGGDVLATRRRLAELREQADGGSGMIESNLTVLDPQDATSGAILAAAMAVPFLAPRRLVVAAGLLDRFAGAQRSRAGTREGAENGSPREARGISALQPLLDVVERDELPPTTDLVITGTAAGRSERNALLTRLKRVPGASIEEMRPPQRRELFKFVREEGVARGIRWHGDGQLSRGSDPVARLVERLSSDTLAIGNELDKLALYSMGREATAEDVDEICSGEKESTVFNMVDALMDGQLGAATSHLKQLRRGGASSQALLGLMASSYRRLAVIQDHLADGSPADEIGKAIGLPWPNLRDAAIARARRHGIEGVRTAYHLILDADRRTKLGEVDEDLAVDVLVFRLAALAPAGRRGATARRG